MSVQTDLLKTEGKREAIIITLISFVFALFAIAITILLFKIFKFDIGGSVDELIRYSVIEVLNDKSDAGTIIDEAIPLALTGLAVAIAFKVGLFNIGGKGQMMIGGAFTGIWGAAIVPDPKYRLQFLDTPFLLIPTMLMIAFITGGIWGFIPGYLKAKHGAHEVITTILMNIIAISFTTYLVGSREYSPFVDTKSRNANSQTDLISDSGRIPVINENFSSDLTWFVLVAVLSIFVAHFLVFKTNFGFQLRAIGLNREAAKTAGINTERITILTMFVSGGFAGLAGAYTVMAFPYRFRIGAIGNTGFDGIAVSLIGQNAPIGLGFAAILFGYLTFSRQILERKTAIPKDIVFVFQSWVILFTAAPLIARRFVKKGSKTMKLQQKEQSSKPPDKTKSPEKQIEEEEE